MLLPNTGLNIDYLHVRQVLQTRPQGGGVHWEGYFTLLGYQIQIFNQNI